MNLENLTKKQLWNLLTETVQKMIMYPNHKSYINEIKKKEKTNPKPQEIAARLNITFGEALVIFNELENKKDS